MSNNAICSVDKEIEKGEYTAVVISMQRSLFGFNSVQMMEDFVALVTRMGGGIKPNTKIATVGYLSYVEITTDVPIVISKSFIEMWENYKLILQVVPEYLMETPPSYSVLK